MPRLEFDIDSELAPERIMGALLDFTERRPKLWPGLNPAEFKVFETGDTWAEIREGNGGGIWARERYDWSQPGQVTWTVMESGFSRPGSFVSAALRPRGSGTRIHITWNRQPIGLLGMVALGVIVLTRGRPVRQQIVAGLKAIAAQPPSPLPPGASV
jgi:hypothetical protein